MDSSFAVRWCILKSDVCIKQMNTGMSCNSALTLVAALSGLGCASSLLGLGFKGPEVLKLDWATRSLNSADVNGDGLNDLVVVNNDLSKIEILYQGGDGGFDQTSKRKVNSSRWDPVLEDARFHRSSVAIGFPVFDMIVGDLNSDGRVDLAYTASEVPLTIRYQSEDGMWSDIQEFDGFEPAGWTDTLSVADLDLDGRLELLLISSDALRVFHQDPGHLRLGEPEQFYITGENPYNMLVEDVSGDGLPDVMYLSANGKQSLALRLQTSGGSFGPERRFILDRPMRRIRVLPQGEGQAALRLCGIDSRNGSLEFFELEQQAPSAERSGLHYAQPEVYPLKGSGRGVSAYSVCDLNGDGLPDLVSSQASDSELLVMMGDANERFALPESYPTLSEVSSLASGLFYSKRNASVVVASRGERIVGLSAMDDAGRMTFPKPIRLADGETPEVCVAMDVDRDGFDELLLVVSMKSSSYLLCLQPKDRSDGLSGWEELSRYELTTLRRKPNAAKELNVFGADRHGLILFVAREAPVFLVADQEAPYDFREFGTESTVRESLLKDVLPTQVSVFNVDGAEGDELVVARKGYARALRMIDDDIEMVDQFNARRGEDLISCVIPVERSGEVVELMFYIAGSGELQFLKREEDAVFRYHTTNRLGSLKLVDWERLTSQSDSGAYLLAGQDRFWRLPQDGDLWGRVFAEQYETDLDGIHYTHLEAAKFDVKSEGMHMVAVDGQSHVVEILKGTAPDWKSVMYWEIFEQNMHYQGRTGGSLEPRQILIADLNGDDLLDFSFLVHDRVLIYIQE